jgi:hypothetical protein
MSDSDEIVVEKVVAAKPKPPQEIDLMSVSSTASDVEFVKERRGKKRPPADKVNEDPDEDDSSDDDASVIEVDSSSAPLKRKHPIKSEHSTAENALELMDTTDDDDDEEEDDDDSSTEERRRRMQRQMISGPFSRATYGRRSDPIVLDIYNDDDESDDEVEIVVPEKEVISVDDDSSTTSYEFEDDKRKPPPPPPEGGGTSSDEGQTSFFEHRSLRAHTGGSMAGVSPEQVREKFSADRRIAQSVIQCVPLQSVVVPHKRPPPPQQRSPSQDLPQERMPPKELPQTPPQPNALAEGTPLSLQEIASERTSPPSSQSTDRANEKMARDSSDDEEEVESPRGQLQRPAKVSKLPLSMKDARHQLESPPNKKLPPSSEEPSRFDSSDDERYPSPPRHRRSPPPGKRQLSVRQKLEPLSSPRAGKLDISSGMVSPSEKDQSEEAAIVCREKTPCVEAKKVPILDLEFSRVSTYDRGARTVSEETCVQDGVQVPRPDLSLINPGLYDTSDLDTDNELENTDEDPCLPSHMSFGTNVKVLDKKGYPRWRFSVFGGEDGPFLCCVWCLVSKLVDAMPHVISFFLACVHQKPCTTFESK